MALRLRRGTDAERLLVTPLEGELIYTTDTKILYIGDGTTVGGLQVTGAFPDSIDDLNDVDISSVAPVVGQILKWDGTKFSPADLVNAGSQINADIIADDSTLLVDSETQIFQGSTFIGDAFVGNTFDGTFNGTFVGDGSGLTNLPIATDGSGIVEGSNYRINIAADDSTIMVDTANLKFTGNLTGDVFGTNSVIIIDSETNSLFTDGLVIENGYLRDLGLQGSIEVGYDERTPLRTTSPTTGTLGGFPYVNFNAARGSVAAPQDVQAGDVIGGFKITGYRTGVESDRVCSVVVAGFDAAADLTEENPLSNLNFTTGAGGASFNIFTMDQIGQFKAPGPVTPGTYADSAARDAAIPSPVAGMIVFVTDVAKHQGYNGVGWNDLY